MIETVDPAECGSYSLHGKHHWREGFLWRRKVTCSGSARIYAPSRTIAQIRELYNLPDSWMPDE